MEDNNDPVQFVHAPFSEAQARSLNAYQKSGVFHEFTCGGDNCREVLVATLDHTGWRCPACSYRQNWAWRWMADDSWRNHFPGAAAAQKKPLIGRLWSRARIYWPLLALVVVQTAIGFLAAWISDFTSVILAFGNFLNVLFVLWCFLRPASKSKRKP